MPPQTRQDYHSPIDTVINVNNAEFGISSGAGARLPPHIKLIATLIDRNPQFEAVIEFLEQRVAETRSRRPVLIVLHGPAAELHRAFILRCENLEIPEILGEGEVFEPLGRLTWPFDVPSVLSVLRSFHRPLHLPRRAKQPKIEEGLTRIAASTSFSHHVDGGDWGKGQVDLFENWIDYVRNDWPDLPDGRIAIGFLCLELPERASRSAQQARTFIEDLKGRHEETPNVLVTDELTSIKPRHVQDWTGDACQMHSDEIDEVTLLNARALLFKYGQEELPLGDIIEDMLDLLSKAYVPRHQATFSGG